MTPPAEFRDIPTTTLADLLGHGRGGGGGRRGGVVVVPEARRARVLADARARLGKEAARALDAWEAAHRARIDTILADNGFEG